MRRSFFFTFICFIALLTLAGCNSTADANRSGSSNEISQMTQPIVNSSIAPSFSGGTSISPENTEENIQRYYTAKAQEEATEIDIEILQADYRVGKISDEDFQTQKLQLEQEKASWDNESDMLEYMIPRNFPEEGWVDTTDLNAMLSKMQEIQIADSEIEMEMYQLKSSYMNGEISREDFVSQQAILEQQEELYDDQEDWLENQMELLGWDD